MAAFVSAKGDGVDGCDGRHVYLYEGTLPKRSFSAAVQERYYGAIRGALNEIGVANKKISSMKNLKDSDIFEDDRALFLCPGGMAGTVSQKIHSSERKDEILGRVGEGKMNFWGICAGAMVGGEEFNVESNVEGRRPFAGNAVPDKDGFSYCLGLLPVASHGPAYPKGIYFAGDSEMGSTAAGITLSRSEGRKTAKKIYSLNREGVVLSFGHSSVRGCIYGRQGEGFSFEDGRSIKVLARYNDITPEHSCRIGSRSWDGMFGVDYLNIAALSGKCGEGDVCLSAVHPELNDYIIEKWTEKKEKEGAAFSPYDEDLLAKLKASEEGNKELLRMQYETVRR
jgi:glutamine amidotransferase-like uncharacterized protein